jgi:hypothetical protein
MAVFVARRRCHTRGMPARRRRHAVTETPLVQAALNELHQALGGERVDRGKLAIPSAQQSSRVFAAPRRHHRPPSTPGCSGPLSRHPSRPGSRQPRSPRRLGAPVTTALLLDNCAWDRLADAAPPTERADGSPMVSSPGIAACLPCLLEAGYSAPASTPNCDLSRIATSTTPSTKRLSTPSAVRRVGHHRLPPVGLLIAALADRRRLGILRYDLIVDRRPSRPAVSGSAIRGTL